MGGFYLENQDITKGIAVLSRTFRPQEARN